MMSSRLEFVWFFRDHVKFNGSRRVKKKLKPFDTIDTVVNPRCDRNTEKTVSYKIILYVDTIAPLAVLYNERAPANYKKCTTVYNMIEIIDF